MFRSLKLKLSFYYFINQQHSANGNLLNSNIKMPSEVLTYGLF
jgi:hypothetical protein